MSREYHDASFHKAVNRPPNYSQLSGERQWEIDGALGILDWDGTHDPKACAICIAKLPAKTAREYNF